MRDWLVGARLSPPQHVARALARRAVLHCCVHGARQVRNRPRSGATRHETKIRRAVDRPIVVLARGGWVAPNQISQAWFDLTTGLETGKPAPQPSRASRRRRSTPNIFGRFHANKKPFIDFWQKPKRRPTTLFAGRDLVFISDRSINPPRSVHYSHRSAGSPPPRRCSPTVSLPSAVSSGAAWR